MNHGVYTATKLPVLSRFLQKDIRGMEQLVSVILAAGKGTRMKSELVKVLHGVAGKPMLAYPVAAARALGSSRIIVVAGHQSDKVEAALQGQPVDIALQAEQLGSGHAVLMAASHLAGFAGDVLILCGDVPLIKPETLEAFIAEHRTNEACVSVLSVELDDPAGYGRILRKNGQLYGIIEHRDATEAQRAVCEINTGIYCSRAPFLFETLGKLKTNNAQGEYYLPDIVSIAAAAGMKVQAVKAADFQEVEGINDRAGLAKAAAAMQARIALRHMANGVTILDPRATYIDADVRIGADTVVYPGASLRGATEIGARCIIDMHCVIKDSRIGSGVHIKPSCVIDEGTIADNTVVGPFAHLRPQAVLDEGARVGNFVEVKKSRIGRGSKVNHLTYIGDAAIGTGVNVGAGTITCNYDGRRKHPTVIEDNVFIGSNTALVAPVTIGKNALIGAGSTITKNVPENALAVARGTQKNYDNFMLPRTGEDKV
jgi:bifunctional UDP-N-acetylglucosamine pyrophosphorylase / glucosamine-1-phosphate N-acetyltransferase